ncbi:hypothetical protein AB0J52_11950 [Spirillospora sp. NPDC049652]
MRFRMPSLTIRPGLSTRLSLVAAAAGAAASLCAAAPAGAATTGVAHPDRAPAYRCSEIHPFTGHRAEGFYCRALGGAPIHGVIRGRLHLLTHHRDYRCRRAELNEYPYRIHAQYCEP